MASSIIFRQRPEMRFTPAGLTDIPSPGNVTGQYTYNTDDALKIAAVVACVGMRAGAFAQLPLKSYRDRNGIAEVVSPQPDLFVRPSSVVVPSVWKVQMSISRDIWGYAAGIIRAVDGAGYPARVDWLMPDTDVRAREYGNAIDWRVGGQPVDGSLILHVPSRWVLPGRPLGISPLKYSGLVDLAKRAQDFGRNWFANGAVPSSIIYSDQELSGEQADGIVQTILTKWRNRKPAVLGAGLRYEKISVPANESQFLETFRQVASDIAISFNLPPEKIAAAVSGQSVTYANREQNTQQYLVDSINPDLVVICESLDQVSPADQYARFSTGAFLQSDLKTRYDSYAVGISNGFLTVDEARGWEELPPMPPQPAAPAPTPDDGTPSNGRALDVPTSLHVHFPEQRHDISLPEVRGGDTHVTVHVPEQGEPVVNVTNEVRTEPTPVEVYVAAPEVRVEVPAPTATVKTVNRDADGRIVSVVEEPHHG